MMAGGSSYVAGRYSALPEIIELLRERARAPRPRGLSTQVNAA